MDNYVTIELNVQTCNKKTNGGTGIVYGMEQRRAGSSINILTTS